MYSGHPHPLLSQIPLSVSPFISLPTAPTLPYTYTPLPSSLPPPFTSQTGASAEKYIISPTSGHKASPEDIIANCKRLGEWVDNLQREGDRILREWEEMVKQEELREKRRVAPGWLDREERVLEPERKTGLSARGDDGQGSTAGLGARRRNETTAGTEIIMQGQQGPLHNAAGDELDRAFGSMELRKS